MKKTALIITILLTLILSFSAAQADATAPSQHDDPRLPYTQADAERYLEMYEDSYNAILESRGPHRIKSLEDQLVLSAPGYECGLPTGNDFTQEQAICIGYHYFQHSYDIPDDTLALYFVDYTFLLQGQDASHWVIAFNPINIDAVDELGCYIFTFNAQTGDIVHVITSETAAG